MWDLVTLKLTSLISKVQKYNFEIEVIDILVADTRSILFVFYL